MNSPSHDPSNFYFELSANGEQTKFKEVDGMSTEVILKNALKPNDNPYAFRLPSPPKTGHLVLKNGTTTTQSKLMQWVAQSHNPETVTDKNKVALRLKDNTGKELMEWTFHSAEPVNEHHSNLEAKSDATQITDLDFKYSFYTFSKK